MRVNDSYVLLREGDCGLWRLQLAFVFNIGEVLYIHNLVSVPSTGIARLPTFEESSWNSIERVEYVFVAIALGFLFFLDRPRTPYAFSHASAGFI